MMSSTIVKPSARMEVRSTRATPAKATFGSAFSGKSLEVAPSAKKSPIVEGRGALQVTSGLADLRDRIASVKNTRKITEAMKLVSAAKVRRAQAAVLAGRPFSEELLRTVLQVNSKLAGEDIDVPITAVRPVKSVLLVALTGDRGLCGGFNSFIIKKTMLRAKELESQGIKVKLVQVGKKGTVFFNASMRKNDYNTIKSMDIGNAPTIEDAQNVVDVAVEQFTSEEVDKVEVIYTKFISLIKGDPVVQTLLPLTKKGELVDSNGICMDIADDEVFKLTSKDGELAVEREPLVDGTPAFDSNITFEQSPEQILEGLIPLYLNAQILRCFQESVASELAARMSAMSTASDNAKELSKNLSLVYNRKRQAKITAEIIELCAGS